jgi:hypothetical protein
MENKSQRWQPIANAPRKPFDAQSWFLRHSMSLLVWNGAHNYIASYRYTERGKGRWLIDETGRVVEPTHWQYLPRGPK